MRRILVRGSNEVGAAVAHKLFVAGAAAIIHEDPSPTTNRRTVAFSDAVFDGEASLAGVKAVRVDDLGAIEEILAAHDRIPLLILPLQTVLDRLAPSILIDARMRKREYPEVQRGLAPLTIGLGPNFTAGENSDLIVETGWGDDLGQFSDKGTTRPLEGDPQPIDGHSRDRFIYAQQAGVFRTECSIGQLVANEQVLGWIDGTPQRAPLAGMLRGLIHHGVAVSLGTKLVEVDPRGAEATAPTNIGARPARIAAGVLGAVEHWQSTSDAVSTR
jgi:xanthine dehydrogenase accessory factor